MPEFRLTTPLKDDDLDSLTLGDRVFITGNIFTVWEGFFRATINEETLPPLDMAAYNVMFFGAPLLRKSQGDMPQIESLIATTLTRMMGPLRVAIPKFNIKATVSCAHPLPPFNAEYKLNHCVSLMPAGAWAGAYYAAKVRQVIAVWEELGPVDESLFLEVEDFGPLIVVTDVRGNSLWAQQDEQIRENLEAVKRSLGLAVDAGALNMSDLK